MIHVVELSTNSNMASKPVSPVCVPKLQQHISGRRGSRVTFDPNDSINRTFKESLHSYLLHGLKSNDPVDLLVKKTNSNLTDPR
jgi:hypothetical protein